MEIRVVVGSNAHCNQRRLDLSQGEFRECGWLWLIFDIIRT